MILILLGNLKRSMIVAVVAKGMVGMGSTRM